MTCSFERTYHGKVYNRRSGRKTVTLRIYLGLWEAKDPRVAKHISSLPRPAASLPKAQWTQAGNFDIFFRCLRVWIKVSCVEKNIDIFIGPKYS